MNEIELTDEQNKIDELFLNRVKNKSPGLIFLDAPGGTGKTFVINLILAKVR